MTTKIIRHYNRLIREWIELNVTDNKIETGKQDSGTVKELVYYNLDTQENISINSIDGKIQVIGG